VLCETLGEAAIRGLIPLFLIKGGVAIELRLGLAARATRDIDIGLSASPDQLVPMFDGALDVGFSDFRLRRKGAIQERGNELRIKISITDSERHASS